MKIKGLMILASSLLILAVIHHSESASTRSFLMKNGSYEDGEVQNLKFNSAEMITNATAVESKRIIPTGPNPLHNR
uniref:CLE19 protein n=1 Tax=Raphanus sativus TaxID=3726 RepID=W6E8R5_RAPSA|nr:CLE19 protein [Raphanus sativus]